MTPEERAKLLVTVQIYMSDRGNRLGDVFIGGSAIETGISALRAEGYAAWLRETISAVIRDAENDARSEEREACAEIAECCARGLVAAQLIRARSEP